MDVDNSAFFRSTQDWLSHTLEHAQQNLPLCGHVLPYGGELVQLGTGIVQVLPPATRQNPNREALIISAGIHGNETAPIELLNQLVNELINGEWQPACPALLILGNPPAMAAGKRFIHANLNRLFSGAHQRAEYQNLAEARRARQLEQLCYTFADHTGSQKLALSHYDLHTAIRPSQREKFALYPFVADRKVPESQCEFLLEAGIHTLLLQHRAGTPFSSFSSTHLNAESFTLELGKARPFGENDLSRLNGVHKAVKRRLEGFPPSQPEKTEKLTVFKVVHEILNSGDSFQFHVPDDVANFTEYAPGTLIWEDIQHSYWVGKQPQAIVFPNRDVPTGQRVGLLVSRVR